VLSRLQRICAAQVFEFGFGERPTQAVFLVGVPPCCGVGPCGLFVRLWLGERCRFLAWILT